MKIIAVGSELREDDAAALVIADKLNYEVIKAGSCPEKFISYGDSVIIIDAVDFGAEPGSVRLISDDEIIESVFTTTHNPSFSLLKDLTRDLFVIGIQPCSINYKQGLSETLNERIDEAASKINLIIRQVLNNGHD